MLIPAFFVYLNYFQPLGIFLFRSFYALICQIIPGQCLPGKIFFLPDVLILFLGRKPAADVPLCLSRWVTSLCTVLLEMAKPFAAWRTVASFSMMYCASRTARSSGKPFTWFPSPVRFFRHPYSMREQRLSILPSGNFSVYYSTNNSYPYV